VRNLHMSEQSVRQRLRTDYSVIFAILALFTAMEVGVGYLPSLPKGIKIGVLVFLAAVKVALVLLYFMHLRFDNRVFALPFALGLVLVVPLVLIVALTIPQPSSPAPVVQTTPATSGAGGQPSQAALVSEGKQLFMANCSMCHDGPNGTGPMFAGMAQRAATRVQGQTAEQYIHQSIVDPSAYVVPGYQDNIMPKDFGQKFSRQQLDALVAYIMADSGSTAGTPAPAGSPTAEATQAAGAATATGQPATPASIQNITVSETTFQISLSPENVQAGQVTFHVVNNAHDLPHQFTIVKTDLPAGQLPVSAGQVDESQLDVIGKTNVLPTGASTDLTATLTPGKYVMFCNVPGHYQAGMYAALTVSGESVGSSAPTASPATATAATGTPQATPTPSGQPTAAATQAAAAATVTVAENTFSLNPSPDSMQAGTITFHVVNQATDIAHQLTVIRTDLAAAKLPVNSQDDPLLNQLDVVGQTADIAPGQSADLTLNLSAGHYVLICALHGHYHAGMYADFTVQ
jgi:uncharacterized cupredoxin-like copper-binding protein/heme/copper-type cytochrome/quinol oxidase subunit 4